MGGVSIILLQVKNISKVFRVGEIEVQALRNVSFEVEEGEFIVILGPSGSGKSTLLNIIGGIETVSDGTVLYRGKALEFARKTEMSRYRKEHIGFVFQFYNLLPNLSALENIEIMAELSEDPLDPGDLLRQVGLSERADHFPSKLSGGQQQRVAIARALCKNPDLLLCDEPTGALDIRTGAQILQLLWDFNREYKKTVLIITHNEKIAETADRVFYVRDGRIDHIGVNQRRSAPEEVEW